MTSFGKYYAAGWLEFVNKMLCKINKSGTSDTCYGREKLEFGRKTPNKFNQPDFYGKIMKKNQVLQNEHLSYYLKNQNLKKIAR